MRQQTLGYSIILAGLLMGTGCVTGFRPGPPAGQTGVIAHRGASAEAPENTLAAFKAAIEQGADYFELDCHLSRDGEVVVIHDGDLARTTDGEGAVAAHPWSALQQLDAGSWFNPAFRAEKLPSLDEALRLARGKTGVYVEIKNVDDDGELFAKMVARSQDHDSLVTGLQRDLMALVEASETRNLPLSREVIALIRKRHMGGQVVIQSFSPVVCLIAKVEAPELRTELLISKSKDQPERWDELVRFGKIIEVDGFNAHHESLDKTFIDTCHDEGRSVAAWTVDDPEVMRRLVALGVDNLITNKPALALQTLEQSGYRGKPPAGGA